MTVQGVLNGVRTGAQIGAFGGPWTAAAGAVIGGVIGGAIGWWAADQISSAMSDANEDAGSVASPIATDVTCATCKDNPCAHLAAGNPASKYRGGAHGAMKYPVGDGLDSHHMPARSISSLPDDVSPAIQMDPEDHRYTNSYGASPATNIVLAEQKEMIDSGMFIAAQLVDVMEIRSLFGDKYDEAILQMELYTACLEMNGLI